MHNIRLDNGELTCPEKYGENDNLMWKDSILPLIEMVLPGDKSSKSIVDLGCLEGGYAYEFARMGFGRSLGIEVRQRNIDCCDYVKQNVNQPALEYVKDNVINIAKYGDFDVVFCCGLLYHIDKPRELLEQLAKQTKKMLIVQTHFSPFDDADVQKTSNFRSLGPLAVNEGLQGRWLFEFGPNDDRDTEALRWASYHNSNSFWIRREALIGLIKDLGFDIVLEQFDGFPNLSSYMCDGTYDNNLRGTFIGIRK